MGGIPMPAPRKVPKTLTYGERRKKAEKVCDAWALRQRKNDDFGCAECAGEVSPKNDSRLYREKHRCDICGSALSFYTFGRSCANAYKVEISYFKVNNLIAAEYGGKCYGATVLAKNSDGSYHVRVHESPYAGKIYGDVTEFSLVVPGFILVQRTDSRMQYLATILAENSDGSYHVRFYNYSQACDWDVCPECFKYGQKKHSQYHSQYIKEIGSEPEEVEF